MRSTRQRAEIVSLLRDGEALGAQEMHARLRERGIRIGLATVYRTLRLLEGEGAVDVLREADQARFRLCSLEHHHHLVCDTCGRVEEIPDCDVDEWAEKVARRRGFRVRAHSAEILGMCRSCTKASP